MSYRALLKSVSAGALLALTAGLPAQAVVFHASSGTIDGSLCVGLDCPASPAFGFDTIRLQENNLRIHFEDTSVAASFPPNDWRLYANDSANGGSSYFGIEDTSAGRFVFRVFAGARSNALTIDAQGDLGLGTATPAVDIDIKTGDTPTVRLQQDNTSGFTPQTWDMAGNETNFFLRDVTNGSRLPFRSRPGAPTSSIDIATDGDVGMGLSSPEARLHVFDNAGSGLDIMLKLENNGDPGLEFENTGNGNIWVQRAGLSMLMDHSNDGTFEFNLASNGNLTILGTLTTTGPTCASPTPCDAVFDPEAYALPSIEEHAALMWENQYLPAVGPTGPDAQFNVTEKVASMLNELEHAHIYIEQLNGEMKAQRAEIAELKAMIAAQ